jgi:hypothetical protein
MYPTTLLKATLPFFNSGILSSRKTRKGENMKKSIFGVLALVTVSVQAEVLTMIPTQPQLPVTMDQK